jgi:hypothetical protein
MGVKLSRRGEASHPLDDHTLSKLTTAMKLRQKRSLINSSALVATSGITAINSGSQAKLLHC